jgi:hypothetical protein
VPRANFLAHRRTARQPIFSTSSLFLFHLEQKKEELI